MNDPLEARSNLPRRLFAWEHALGCALSMGVVCVISTTFASMADQTMQAYKSGDLPVYTRVAISFAALVRQGGWMGVVIPAISVGFVLAAIGSRGRRKFLAIRMWAGLGAIVAVGLGLAIYAPLMSAMLNYAGRTGGK